MARLLCAPVKHIALENPVSIISSKIRKPDQVIQPWMFGHGETKATCLWLKNLPPLKSTNIVEGREQRIWKLPPSDERWKERSRTYSGIAEAMANQWTLATRPNDQAHRRRAGEQRLQPEAEPAVRCSNLLAAVESLKNFLQLFLSPSLLVEIGVGVRKSQNRPA